MSALKQYADAIYKAKADRDKKVLAILADALGCEATVEAVSEAGTRLHKWVHADRAETFFVDGNQVCYASQPQCSQEIVSGVVTVIATYELTDFRK